MPISTTVEEVWENLEVTIAGLDQPLELFRGKPSNKHDIPKKPGVYAIFYEDGKCFYVGSSQKNIRERLMTHYRDKGDIKRHGSFFWHGDTQRDKEEE